MTRRTARTLLTATLSLCVAYGHSALVTSAAAQGGRRVAMNFRGGGMDWMGATVSSRELEEFGKVLALTPEQQEAAKVLHESYQEQQKELSDRARKKMEEVRQEFEESHDPSVWQSEDFRGSLKKMGEDAARLEKQFLDDVKVLLTDEQQARWPKVERLHRRNKELPQGMLSGEGLDLVDLVNDMEVVQPSEELGQLLEQYETEMDRALTERSKIREEAQKDMEKMDSSTFDFQAMRKRMEGMRKAGVPVRNVNDKYARLLETALPEDARPRFNERFKKDKYPRVFREPYTAKALKSAVEFDDLEPGQRADLAAINETYQRELASANDRWAAAVAEQEADGGGDPFGGFGAFVPGGDGKTDPVADAQKARRDLDKATLDKVKALLTDDQKERLPEREANNDDAVIVMPAGGGAGVRRRGRDE